MHKLLLATTLSAMLVFPAIAADDSKAPSESAMVFVGQFSNDHLSGMLSRLGGRSKVFIGLAQAHGEIVGRVLELAINDAVLKHGPQWQTNMATAWDPLLTDEEFDSLRNAGAQSPHTDKYLELRSEAGQTMQASSQELFQEIMAEVMSDVQAALESTNE